MYKTSLGGPRLCSDISLSQGGLRIRVLNQAGVEELDLEDMFLMM